MDNIIMAKIKKVFGAQETKGVGQKLTFISKFFNTPLYGDVYMANVVYSGRKLRRTLSVDYIIKEGAHGLKVCVEPKFLPELEHIKAVSGVLGSDRKETALPLDHGKRPFPLKKLDTTILPLPGSCPQGKGREISSCF